MNCYYITFRSVTHAQRGEGLLRGKQIRCSIQRTPRWMESQGCGYALRLWTEDVGSITAMLRQEKLPLRRIYRQKADGQLEEVGP